MGQVRWPKGPPHLALNPPYLFLLFFLFCFFCFFGCLIHKKPCFSPRKGHFLFIFSVSFLSPLAFLGLPLFVFLFLCLSFFFFLSFFLLVFVFAFFWFLVFVSFFLFFFFCAFLSWKEQHQKIQLQAFSSSIFYFFLVSCLFFSSSFFLSLPFPDFKLCFLFSIKVLVSKQTTQKNRIVWSKGGLQQNGFFINLCFAKCETLCFFCAPFLGKFWVMFKKHYKNRYFSTSLKAKKMKKWPFLIVTNWATLIVTNWATFAQLKKRQRGPVSNY